MRREDWQESCRNGKKNAAAIFSRRCNAAALTTNQKCSNREK